MAYSYACADCESMEACPGKVVAETEGEIWKLMELHANITHDEDASEWGEETPSLSENADQDCLNSSSGIQFSSGDTIRI